MGTKAVRAMRHYHGTPLGGTRESVARFLAAGNRHLLIPFGHHDDMPIAAEMSCGLCVDNGAFSAWRKGEPITNWRPYYEWCKEWHQCPRFDFAIIPDVIDGTEEQNDALFAEWFKGAKVDGGGWVEGAPVWHLHESMERLARLMGSCRYICLGSSGEYATPGTPKWTARMAEAMAVLCDKDGKPLRKIHGLRMLSPAIVERYPFYSADSTNVAQNSQLIGRFGTYKPPTQAQRREVMASRIEATRSPSVWTAGDDQRDLFTLEAECLQ